MRVCVRTSINVYCLRGSPAEQHPMAWLVMTLVIHRGNQLLSANVVLWHFLKTDTHTLTGIFIQYVPANTRAYKHRNSAHLQQQTQTFLMRRCTARTATFPQQTHCSMLTHWWYINTSINFIDSMQGHWSVTAAENKNRCNITNWESFIHYEPVLYTSEAWKKRNKR